MLGPQVLGCPEHLYQAFERQLRSSRESPQSLGDGRRDGRQETGKKGGAKGVLEQVKNWDQLTNKVVRWLMSVLSGSDFTNQ